MSTRQAAVTDRLREEIIAGRYPPETRLEEVALARALGVSRTPVRAALLALGQEGLLTYRPQRGYVVRRVSVPEVLDAYAVRGRLESLACRLLAERGAEAATLATLRGALAEAEHLLAPGRLTDEAAAPWREMNNRLHETILHATRNPVLIDLTARTLALPLTSSRVVHWVDFAAIRRSHEHHQVIVEAIARRQPDRAEAMMTEHIQVSADYLRRHLREEAAAAAAPAEGGSTTRAR